MSMSFEVLLVRDPRLMLDIMVKTVLGIVNK